jgi:hypothetical protein
VLHGSGSIRANREDRVGLYLRPRSTGDQGGVSFLAMAVVFLGFAALWVLAWVVLLVIGFLNVVFRPLPDLDYGNERDLSGEGPAG